MLFGIYANIALRDFGKSYFKFGLYLSEVRNSVIFRVVSYSGTMRALPVPLFGFSTSASPIRQSTYLKISLFVGSTIK